MKRVSKEQLMRVFKIGSFTSVDGFLRVVGRARGKLLKGGLVDKEASARLILKEWNEGNVPYYTLPPERKSH